MVDKSILVDELSIECQLCHSVSELREWEEKTYGACVTREMRRKYTSLKEIKAYGKKHGASYKCPKCDGWSRGCQLLLRAEDGEVIKGLGGHPISGLGGL